MMTHSGYKVSIKNYSETISQVDDTFLTVINQYCHTLFSKALELHTCKLGPYISAYANMYEDGAFVYILIMNMNMDIDLRILIIIYR